MTHEEIRENALSMARQDAELGSIPPTPPAHSNSIEEILARAKIYADFVIGYSSKYSD